MERLKERLEKLKNGTDKMFNNETVQVSKKFCNQVVFYLEKLKEYKDLEEQGLLLKLPYKAGERVWILYKDKLIEENYVASIQIGEKHDRLCFADGCVYTIWNKDYEKVKKWVYTSKAEAEKALAEMKGE